MVSPPEPPGEDGYFDERVAATFDEEYDYQAEDDVVVPMVELIAGLARGKRALELGSGTGRIAIPLAARGVPVHGIELSKAMTRRLKAKPGGQGIEVTVGDFASARAPGTFGVAYLVANTIMNLTTQAEQVACFRNVAAHLEPAGFFLIEVLVPGLQRLPPGDTFQVFAASDGHWGIDEIDPATQRLVSHHFTLVGATYELDSIPFRYVWPAELDLMAELAGMQLRDRCGGWHREPFTRASEHHVSVWQKGK